LAGLLQTQRSGIEWIVRNVTEEFICMTSFTEESCFSCDVKGERQADQGQSEQQMRKATEGKRFGKTKKYFLGVCRETLKP
jgi:hypothetical protein